MKEHLDVVGHWTEMKLQILQDYAKAYAQIFKISLISNTLLTLMVSLVLALTFQRKR